MLIETYHFRDGKSLEVHTDDDPESPRSCGTNGTMVCFHRRYNLGDKHDYKSSDFNGWDTLQAQIEEDHDVVAILPLYLYDHSDLTIATSPFSCPWDSGQVGFIFATRANLKAGGHPDDVAVEKVLTWLHGEVKAYDHYLRDDICGFILRGPSCESCDGEGKEESSCWGFYGSDPTENGMMDHLDPEYRKALKGVAV